MWSVGCILAELLGGEPILKGKDYVDQLNQTLHYLGTPSEDTMRRRFAKNGQSELGGQ
ncbi:hypothetical protein FIBSPDRAFT_954969 [Athelia psychrophila]|uniref:Protein kinase domain-containing protein n=1 Tax=Athelia psychrophila TaxID=1759441 RepID=A0A166IJV8_9AGAM|nr:hypothetical protein FIBSPDRAFT_954969 [Fibularhizoctonia sp. CBS 109695]